MFIPPRGKSLHRATWCEFIAFLITYIDLLLARWDGQDLGGRATPVSLSSLREKGIEDHILIWMLYQDHIEHFQPASASDSSHSVGMPMPSVHLNSCSSFSLTDSGAAFAERFLDDTLVPMDRSIFETAWDRLLVGHLLPHYDKDNRIFTWGRHILKCFRQPAINQELILRAAEELCWEAWMDDPLPHRAHKNPKELLHDTIKDLNRRQTSPLIHFKGDGTGVRVGWEYR